MTDVVAGAVSAQLEWVDAGGITNFLQFDVVVNESWTNGSAVTEHPVEVGADVGDHVRVKLVTCELKVRSTNEPIDGNNWDQATVGPVEVDTQVWTNPITARALLATGAGAALSPAGTAAGGLGAIGGAFAAAAVLPAFASTVQTFPLLQAFPLGIDYVERTHALLVELQKSAQLLNVFGTKQTQYSMVIENLVFVRDANTGTGEDITISLKQIRVVSSQTVPAPIPNLSAGGGLKTVDHGGQEPSIAKKSLAVQAVNAATSALGSLGQLAGRL